MKATEVIQGGEYEVSYLSHRCRLETKGQGHGQVHTVVPLDVLTGEELLNPDGSSRARAVSSRDLIQTFEQRIASDPGYMDRVRQQKAAAEQKKQEEQLQLKFLETHRGICEDTAGLLQVLGFEAEVMQVHPHFAEHGFYIKINNPTENQDILRRMAAEKYRDTLGAESGGDEQTND